MLSSRSGLTALLVVVFAILVNFWKVSQPPLQSSLQPQPLAKAVPVRDAFTWTPDQARQMEIPMLGTSACGATALANVLLALGMPLDNPKSAVSAVNTTYRKRNVSVCEYLAARASAGANASKIAAGCAKLTDGKVVSRFFAFYPSRSIDLHCWLASWLSKGCSAIAHLNTQQHGADFWHNQMIYGISGEGVFMTNPDLGIANDLEEVLVELESPPIMQIRKEHALACTPFISQACDAIGLEWKRLGVSEQLEALRVGNIDEQYVYIPKPSRTGITIFARRGSEAAEELAAAMDLPLANEFECESISMTEPETCFCPRKHDRGSRSRSIGEATRNMLKAGLLHRH